MNCRDISRITDTGAFGKLTAAERQAAETHALSCRHCAPVWAAHARLAELRIPAMPAELSARCQALAALPDRTRGRPALRRLTLVGSLAVLAAAAALLTNHLAGTPVTEPQSAAVAPAATEPVPPPAIAEIAIPVVEAAKPVPVAPARDEPVPLLPLPNDPIADASKRIMGRTDLILQKAVERHPELVEGPEIDGTFVVGVALRSDDSVFTSTVRHALPDGYAAASAEIDALIPGEGGVSGVRRPKATRLFDRRTLRADVVLSVRSIPDGFDFTRSRSRLLQILGDKYAHLTAPLSNGELTRLEVFLSEDGRILREQVSTVRSGDNENGVTSDPADVARFAKGLAARLGVDVGQFGVVGITGLSLGPMTAVTDPAGGPPRMANTPHLLVNYAWERRAGESAPTLGSGTYPQVINQTAALAIVERYIPDAFTARDPAAGQLAVILTARGEFIRAGRLPQSPSISLSSMKTLQEQLAGDISLGRAQRVKLTNASGMTAEVDFAWERPKAEPVN